MQLWGGLGVPKARSPWALAWGRHPQLGRGADGVAVVRSPLNVAVSIAVAVAVAVPPFGKGGLGDSLFDPVAAPTAKANPPRTDHFRATNPHRRSPPFTKWAPTFADDSTVSICMHRLCIYRPCMHRHPNPSAFAVPPFGKGGLGGFAFRSGRHAKRKSESPAHRSLPHDQPASALAPFYKVGTDFRALHRQGVEPASIDTTSITIGSQPRKPIAPQASTRLTHPDRCAIPSPDARCPPPRARRPR
jgi:hypothetical protein